MKRRIRMPLVCNCLPRFFSDFLEHICFILLNFKQQFINELPANLLTLNMAVTILLFMWFFIGEQ